MAETDRKLFGRRRLKQELEFTYITPVKVNWKAQPSKSKLTTTEQVLPLNKEPLRKGFFFLCNFRLQPQCGHAKTIKTNT